MKIKDLKIGIVMTLALTIMVAPTIKASALEPQTKAKNPVDYNKTLNMTEEEYTKFLKEDFKETYGTENKFKTTYEDDHVKAEVNPATTEFKVTNKATNGVDSYNYFESLDERVKVSEMTKEEYTEYLKDQVTKEKEAFKKQFGNENKFKVVYEDELTKEEVNGITGECKVTVKNTKEVNKYNYFDIYKEEVNNSVN